MLYLYIDESGDLGFDFVNKKPSQYFTLTVLAVNREAENWILFKAVKRTLNRKLNPQTKRKRTVNELKGARTSLEIKRYFFKKLSALNISLYAITLNKRKLAPFTKGNKSRLYNYLARKVLDQLDLENCGKKIYLIIDRSKPQPEIREFNDYIRKNLEAKLDPAIPLIINHFDSAGNYGLQAADMFSYGFFAKYEKAKDEWFKIFNEKVKFDLVYPE